MKGLPCAPKVRMLARVNVVRERSTSQGVKNDIILHRFYISFLGWAFRFGMRLYHWCFY